MTKERVNISLMRRATGALALLFLLGCATTKSKPACPDIATEPVSSCRAQEKCKQNKTSYGFGLGLGIGSNLGEDASQSQNTENYTKCIDKDLAEQKAMNEPEGVTNQNNETKK